MADYIWDKVQIIDWKCCLKVRKIKETEYIKQSKKCQPDQHRVEFAVTSAIQQKQGP